ncbi:hypothetical protein [Sphingomonas sp. LR55]|uniref:hypothetical protein n=1 Tax=Sphingomonas sp. LR55 TaxID=3050231 RepID=UPI002FE03B79
MTVSAACYAARLIVWFGGAGAEMEEVIAGVHAAVDSNALYAALALALAVPDICARVETPDVGSAVRYSRWWNENAVGKYTFNGWDGKPRIFLTGNDVYALRCALLHEGQADITAQRARQALERFIFTEDCHFHCNLIENVLQLSVATLCRDIANAAAAWAGRRRGDGQTVEPQAVISILPTGSSIR